MAKKDKSTGTVQTSAQTAGEGVTIRAPHRPIGTNEYVCRHVNIRLTPKAAGHLKIIFKGLYGEHRTLSNGRHIDIPAHAVCWLLENVQQSSTSPGLNTVLIRAPFGPLVSGELVCRTVDARLTRPAAETLKGIWKGLYEEHRTLSNGRHIDIPAHAVCWLLENAELPKALNRSLAS